MYIYIYILGFSFRWQYAKMGMGVKALKSVLNEKVEVEVYGQLNTTTEKKLRCIGTSI